jgi:hypothetical protein
LPELPIPPELPELPVVPVAPGTERFTPALPPVAEMTVIGATPKEEVAPAPPTVKGCGPGKDGAGYVLIAAPPPPPPPLATLTEVVVGLGPLDTEPPLPPPPTTVTLMDLTVAGFVHVLELVYTFIAVMPVPPAVACVVASGNTTPDAPILVVAMFYSLTTRNCTCC